MVTLQLPLRLVLVAREVALKAAKAGTGPADQQLVVTVDKQVKVAAMAVLAMSRQALDMVQLTMLRFSSALRKVLLTVFPPLHPERSCLGTLSTLEVALQDPTVSKTMVM